MMTWKWIGDRDYEAGGAWIRPVPEHGYADAVRITPCSDAGGPDNLFWVEVLTIFGMDEAEKREKVIKSVGWEIPDNHYAWANEFMQCGYADPGNCYPSSSSETVQVGKKRDTYCRDMMDEVKTTVTLRSDACIGRYARKLAAGRC